MLELDAERLAARVEELEREKAALEEFAAVAAHELMEPLIITEAYATMVYERLDKDLHAESRRDLAALSRTASRTRLLLEALLHDARSTEHRLSCRSIDLNALVAGCVEMLAPEIVAQGTKLHVGDLPVVSGDESLLSGLFTNLLLNAFKYSRREGANISVRASLEGPFWQFSVVSEGPTIPPEDRQRIFEPYQRGRDERRTRGSGLGLAICRRIVERHGGQIGVAPATDGNRFFFSLPA